MTYPGDAFLRSGVVVWLLCLVPSFLAVLSPDATLYWADQWIDAPILAFVLVALQLRIRRAVDQPERVFWRFLIGFVVAWLSVTGLYAVVPWEHQGTRFDVAINAAYLLGYLCLALALEVCAGHRPARGSRSRERRNEFLAVLAFGFGLLSYLALVPSLFNPEVYASWVSSMLFYAVLDVYLLVRGVTLLHSDLVPGWRKPMTWICITCALWLVGDVTEALMYMGTIPTVDPGTPLDVLWALPVLTLLIAVHGLSRASARTQEVSIAK